MIFKPGDQARTAWYSEVPARAGGLLQKTRTIYSRAKNETSALVPE